MLLSNCSKRWIIRVISDDKWSALNRRFFGLVFESIFASYVGCFLNGFFDISFFVPSFG